MDIEEILGEMHQVSSVWVTHSGRRDLPVFTTEASAAAYMASIGQEVGQLFPREYAVMAYSPHMIPGMQHSARPHAHMQPVPDGFEHSHDVIAVDPPQDGTESGYFYVATPIDAVIVANNTSGQYNAGIWLVPVCHKEDH